MLTLLSLPLRSKRDILLARQHARHIASMFQFDSIEQACIAAGTFALAAQAVRVARKARLYVQIEKPTLHVFAQRGLRERPAAAPSDSGTAGMLRLAKALPAAAAQYAVEDVAWMVRQLNEQRSFNVFEEVQRQNEELLVLLHALHQVRSAPPEAHAA